MYQNEQHFHSISLLHFTSLVYILYWNQFTPSFTLASPLLPSTNTFCWTGFPHAVSFCGLADAYHIPWDTSCLQRSGFDVISKDNLFVNLTPLTWSFADRASLACSTMSCFALFPEASPALCGLSSLDSDLFFFFQETSTDIYIFITFKSIYLETECSHLLVHSSKLWLGLGPADTLALIVKLS